MPRDFGGQVGAGPEASTWFSWNSPCWGAPAQTPVAILGETQAMCIGSTNQLRSWPSSHPSLCAESREASRWPRPQATHVFPTEASIPPHLTPRTFLTTEPQSMRKWFSFNAINFGMLVLQQG